MIDDNDGFESKKISSDDVRSILEARGTYLADLIKKKRDSLKEVPSGSLHISKCRNKAQYYHYFIEKTGEAGKTYIPESRKNFIYRLAQKDYDGKVLREAEKENRLIQNVLTYYRGQTADTVFERLSDSRQKIVMPLEKSQEEFVREWSTVSYEGKGFAADAAELITDRGEQVRSKSELIIANLLNQEKIPYRYEYPVSLQGLGIVYPDFTVLNVRTREEILWEHQGMMDDPEYAGKAIRKVQAYIMNGYLPGKNLILTPETRSIPLSVRVVRTLIREFCI